MKREQLVVEARAKIIWGEPAASVRHFLITNGFSEAEAEAEISRHQRERYGSIRRQGIAAIIVGLPLLVIGVVLAQHVVHCDTTAIGAPSTRALQGELAIALIAGGYGLWKLVNGIFALVKPSSEDRSITEL